MPKNLAMCGRTHLKQTMQIFKQALKVIKKTQQMQGKIEGKSSQVLVNVLKPYFIKFFEFQNLPHILSPY